MAEEAIVDEERLEAAAAYGRRMAAETNALMHRMQAKHDFMLNYLANTDAARRHVQAASGTESDAMCMVFDAGDKPLERPRPRLVHSEGG